MPLTKIGKRSELPAPGEAREFEAGGKVICVANVNGQCSAIDNECVHEGGPLGQGVVEEGKVVCPWHGWQYDAKTGKVSDSSDIGVSAYPLHIEGDDVFVDV